MTNQLQVFNFEGADMRTVTINNEPWFVAKDVCDLLHLRNSRQAMARVDAADKNTVIISDGTKGNPNRTIINESGMYTLVLTSSKPEALRFKRWVTSEVLPTIRKHGAYMTDSTLEQMLANPDLLIGLASKLKEEQALRAAAMKTVAEQRDVIAVKDAELKALDEKIEDMTPKVTYYDTILQSHATMTVTQIAKDYGITAAKLNSILHDEKIQYKCGSQWVPYQKYAGKGYTKSKTYKYSMFGTNVHTQWTQKGRLLIHSVLTRRGVFPCMG